MTIVSNSNRDSSWGDISDIRCIKCGNNEIRVTVKNSLEGAICGGCGATFDKIWGVPYFGDFEADDILGLIEISANIINRGKFGINPEVVERWEKLLSDYHHAEDKERFVKHTPEAQSPYWGNRYGEWVEVMHLTKGLNLNGLKVLDIGAGLGFDSHRLSMRGANVTALEFSPILAESGQISFPGIRWIGGFSHCLPFKNATFDTVFCNAALHHMKDIPAAISESLRVLKPGGMLITTCDSFRPSDADNDFELKIFDKDPDVLSGVNEGVPRFSEFVSVLQQHADTIKTEVFTHTLYDGLLKTTIKELTPWNIEKDGNMLSKCSGSLALRVTLRAPWPIPGVLQTDAVLSARDYAASLSSEVSAMAKLAQLMPALYVDLPFPGGIGSKFDLLNGWRLKKPFHNGRIAYRRGRWFLRRSADADTLAFDVKLPSMGTETAAHITVMLNGKESGSFHIVSSRWTRAAINLSKISADQVFAVEIQLQGGGQTLEENCFMVKNRSYKTKKVSNLLSKKADGESCVYAVIPVFNRIHFTLACIKDLKEQTYPNIQIIVADGGSTDGTIDEIRRRFPDVVVLTAEKELWWTGAMAMGIEHALYESNGRDDFVLMMNNDTQIPENYVSSLMAASRIYEAAVGAIVVDSRDPSCILDAGEYIDWDTYSFPVNTDVDPDDDFRDDVDVLPGRGSLIPMEMIRVAGNVDAQLLPHYLADYEFFYRLKKHGFRLGVYYGIRLLSHIEETGIVPGTTGISFRIALKELFSRRSMTNVIDHWRFVRRHAPSKMRVRIQLRLILRAAGVFLLRTPLRPIGVILVGLFRLQTLFSLAIKGQFRSFFYFLKEFKEKRVDILCNPKHFPALIRLPIYLFASPGPVRQSECIRHGLDVENLMGRGILRPIEIEDWYKLTTLNFGRMNESKNLKRLFWLAWNPCRKLILLIRVIKKL